MADITHIFDGEFSLPAVTTPRPAAEQLIDAMAEHGLTPPTSVVLDGQLHRFKSGTKGSGGAGDKTGWYVAYGDGVAAGKFGCWRAGVEVLWREEGGKQLSAAEEMAHARRMAEIRKMRDEEMKKQHETAANTVSHIWDSCGLASDEHPYLKRKGVAANGARVTGDGRLVVPLYTPNGEMVSLQYIAADGGKLYHSGGKTGGSFWVIGDTSQSETIYIAEGFATAATVHNATKTACVVAYSASNLVPVTEHFAALKSVIIVADNDESGVGQRYAEQACAKYNARMVMPPMKGDANDYAAAGGDIVDLLIPKNQNWFVDINEIDAHLKPISYLIKKVIPRNSIGMIYGASGSGKTFTVISLMMAIAGALPDWFGYKVRQGKVAYLAGEGYAGILPRIKGFMLDNKISKADLLVSTSGCDFNTEEGYAKIVNSLAEKSFTPDVIVVDTLNRFMVGDENSAKDVRSMLDYCDRLQRKYNCTIILIHHTGVGETAQTRARGSSALRGAFDFMFLVAQGESGHTIEHYKAKDSELIDKMHFELASIDLPGLFDEDGEQVTTAVCRQAEAPEASESGSETKYSVKSILKQFKNAWRDCGREFNGEYPFLSRSGYKDYLATKEGVTEKASSRYLAPTGRLIQPLLVGQYIEATQHGWIMIKPEDISIANLSGI